ncbi:2Fe-2S iron-sulfur cluster-binding protein [Hydrogenophaga sp.]|jgi:2Fe-2S ferredoxin|uniref:2Fe-2S iron-sulfur cluster-binding protein n=1 Tax=Hydrogenophaga sp. TaxID=1904254 RepID=UPI003F6EDB26
MAWITYVSADGTRTRVDVPDGSNLMLGAVHNNVPGIDGECGGCLSCATCHVYLDAEWAGRLAPADQMELEMLEAVAAERRPTSRLGCQIVIDASMDEMPVHLPELQT